MITGVSVDQIGPTVSGPLAKSKVPCLPWPELSKITCPAPSSKCHSATVCVVLLSGVTGGTKVVVYMAAFEILTSSMRPLKYPSA